MPYYRVFGVADNESETRFSKFKMTNPIWPSLYSKKVSIFMQLSQVTWKTIPQGFLKR